MHTEQSRLTDSLSLSLSLEMGVLGVPIPYCGGSQPFLRPPLSPIVLAERSVSTERESYFQRRGER